MVIDDISVIVVEFGFNEARECDQIVQNIDRNTRDFDVAYFEDRRPAVYSSHFRADTHRATVVHGSNFMKKKSSKFE